MKNWLENNTVVMTAPFEQDGVPENPVSAVFYLRIDGGALVQYVFPGAAEISNAVSGTLKLTIPYRHAGVYVVEVEAVFADGSHAADDDVFTLNRSTIRP